MPRSLSVVPNSDFGRGESRKPACLCWLEGASYQIQTSQSTVKVGNLCPYLDNLRVTATLSAATPSHPPERHSKYPKIPPHWPPDCYACSGVLTHLDHISFPLPPHPTLVMHSPRTRIGRGRSAWSPNADLL
jgi:hypothetical protein